MKRHTGKTAWQKLLAMTLISMFLLELFSPLSIQPAYAVGTYGKATGNGVNVRKQPNTKSPPWFQIDQGYVCPVEDTTTVDGKVWYKVKATHPDPKNSRQYTGYIHSDFFTLLSMEEATVWEANPVQPNGGTAATAGPSAQATATAAVSYTIPPVNSGAIGEITNGEVNFREEAAKYGKVLMKLNRGTQVEILVAPTIIDTQHYFQVRYAGLIGYIQAPFVRVVNSGSGNTIIATNTPQAALTPTPPPTVTGYAKLIKDTVNLRVTPGGKVGTQWKGKGNTLPIYGALIQRGGYSWYPVLYDQTQYYVRNDMIEVVSAPENTVVPAITETVNPGAATLPPPHTQNPAVTAAPTSVLPPSANGYARLILSSTTLHTSPGGDVGQTWGTQGEVVVVLAGPTTVNGVKWYPIDYHGVHYFVIESAVQMVSTPNATLAPGLPTAAPSVTTTASPNATPSSYGYVKVTADRVNLRLQPAGAVVQQVTKNTVLPVISPMISQDGYGWYHVQVNNVRGYLRGDNVIVSQADGSPVTPETTTNPLATATPAPNQGYVKVIHDRVKMRTNPKGKSVETLTMGTVMPITGAPQVSGKYTWYPVTAPSGKTGVIRGDLLALTDAAGNPIGGTATPAPSATPAPFGYFMVTVPSVKIRKSPGGTSDGTVPKDTVLFITGAGVKKDKYEWLPVRVDAKTGYIRSDMGFVLSPEQTANYLAGLPIIPTPTSAPAVQYVQTIVDRVYLRTAPSKDAAAPHILPLGTVLAYSTTQSSGGTRWYKVVHNNTELWISGTTIKVMTAEEYNQYIANTPQATPQPEVILGYVRTSKGGVNVRTTANGGNIITRIASAGTVMPFSKQPETVKKYNWYYVKTPDGKYGYVRNDFITLVQADGSPMATPTPNPQATPPGGGAEASYKTLKLGSSGTDVRKLVAELKAQGYFFGEITSSYTSAVEAAVKTFQIAKQINPDGIAGANTQHALFGTVPEGSTGEQLGGMTLFAAEKVDWYTGDIQQLWPKGANFKVYDVQTGRIWTAHRWSGGKHVDAEPLTAADTATLCKIYGISNAREIASKNLWQRRPSLVTIGNRTFACSVYGVPHNYPAGDTIANNNFNGQLCIHFSNSRTHTSNKVDSYHTKAIQYAWENAPNGRK